MNSSRLLRARTVLWLGMAALTACSSDEPGGGSPGGSATDGGRDATSDAASGDAAGGDSAGRDARAPDQGEAGDDAGDSSDDGEAAAPLPPWPDACAPAPPAPTGATVTVDVCHPAAPVPTNFLGLAVEWTRVLTYLGDGAGNGDPMAVQLLKNFDAYGHRVDLRIGGNTTDRAWWVNGPGTRGPLATVEVTPVFLTTLKALYSATGAHLILGLDLALRDPTNPAAFMKAAIAALPAGSITAFEIGNEPNWYQSNMVRPAPYKLAQYEADLDAYLAALKPSIGSGTFCGPAFGELGWVPDVPMLFPKYAGDLGLLTLHRYPYSACTMPSPTAASLLADTASEGLAMAYAQALSVAKQQGIGLRLDEIGSLTCGGIASVGESYAASLWSAETLFALASAGAVGINFYTPAGNAVFTVDPGPTGDAGALPDAAPLPDAGPGQDAGSPVLSVHGTYYGMLFFAAGTDHGGRLAPAQIAPVSAQAKLKAWATMGSDGRARVSLLNKDPTTAAHVTVQVAGAQGSATLARLQAPALDALTGIRFAGRTFDGSTDGKPVGSETLETIAGNDGSYTFDMPALSGAIVVAQP